MVSVSYPGSVQADQIHHIYHFTYHTSDIFPGDTDLLVTVTAHSSADTFNTWAELIDNTGGTPLTLSAIFAAEEGHIADVLIEDCSAPDKRYLLELSFGASKVILARTRFMKATNKLGVSQSTRVRSPHVPAGETVYYRLKCETGSATAEIHVRYYLGE